MASWIERTNRYTSRPDRVQASGGHDDLIKFSHDRLDHWMRRTASATQNDYPAAVALLRAIYDMVDRLKAWETERGLDGEAMLAAAREALVAANGPSPCRGGKVLIPAAIRCAEFGDNPSMERQAMLVQLRATEAQSRERTETARKANLGWAATRDELAAALGELSETHTALAVARHAVDATRGVLDETRTQLHQTQSRLTETRQEIERLSGSARVFVRQYLPKLRRHLLRA